jgi:hypothetical protein
MKAEGINELLERPAPLALVTPGLAEMEACLCAGGVIREKVDDAVEFRHGVLQLGRAAGLPFQ